jgi:hypothetical protein
MRVDIKKDWGGLAYEPATEVKNAVLRNSHVSHSVNLSFIAGFLHEFHLLNVLFTVHRDIYV